MTMQETVDELTALVERLTDLVIRLEARTDKLETALRPRPDEVCNSEECYPLGELGNYDHREIHTHGEECSVDCDCGLGVPVGDWPGGAYPTASTSGSVTFNHASMVAAINTEALGARFTNKQPEGATAEEAEAWVKANFQFEPQREFPNGPEL